MGLQGLGAIYTGVLTISKYSVIVDFSNGDNYIKIVSIMQIYVRIFSIAQGRWKIVGRQMITYGN